MKIIALWLCLFWMSVSSVQAAGDEVALLEMKKEMAVMKATYDKELAALRAEVQQLRAQHAAAASAPIGIPPTRSFVPNVGSMVPGIGVVADIVGKKVENKEDKEGNDKLSVRELEFVLGQDMDPWTRLDATIAFSDLEDPSLEEAYATWSKIPHVKTRLGRMKPKMGKAIAVHRDSLETVDEPWVVQRYWGVEGLARTGVDASVFLPFSNEKHTHEWTVGAYEGGGGEDGEALGETRRIPTYTTHLANFFNLQERTSLEVGGTYVNGSRDEDSHLELQAYGADVTLLHHFDPIHRVKAQMEFWLLDMDEIETPEQPWGAYALLDYRLNRSWDCGVRYDWVEVVNQDSVMQPHMKSWSTYLTFHQSEFLRWRLQYENVDHENGHNEDIVFLQGTVTIGTRNFFYGDACEHHDHS